MVVKLDYQGGIPLLFEETKFRATGNLCPSKVPVSYCEADVLLRFL